MIPAVFRRNRRAAEHVAPGRLTIAWIQLRTRARNAWMNVQTRHLRPLARRAMPWAAGFSFVLAYLVLAGWVQRHDLERDLAAANRAAHKSAEEAQRAKDQLGQVRATGTCETLFYLVEARNPREVFAKLTQAANQLEADRAAAWHPFPGEERR